MRDKSKELAVMAVKLSDTLVEQKRYSIADQMLRSCTSVGANIRESEYASTNKDYLAKIHIAMKECNEAMYWLELIGDCGIACVDDMMPICGELIRIMSSAAKTAREKEEQRKK